MIELNESIWSISLKTQIHFGRGVFGQTAKILGATGKRRHLIVCGNSAQKFGYTEHLKSSLRELAEIVVVYDRISKDPTSAQVQEILEIIQSERIDCIIALGGGSAIDAAKAASVIAPLNTAIENVFSGDVKLGSKKVFCVAVPTTAGTGAELSRGAIITWESRNIKTGIRHDLVSPDIAIVDPDLTVTVPVEQVKITGFDIFTHAVETYISKKANPMTEAYSLMAIRAVARNLALAIHSSNDISSRIQLSFYSMMMGFNLANSSTCLPHRLQYPLGILTGSEHALGLAALYPAWVQLTAGASPEKFARISSILADELGVKDQGIVAMLNDFMTRIGLNPKLSQLGVSGDQCAQLASLVEGALDNDPWWKPGSDLVEFYRLSL